MKRSANKIKQEYPILIGSERAILIRKIELAREQIKNGDFLTKEELDQEIKTWIASEQSDN